MDRGYAKFALFNRIVNAKSSYVCRIRDNSVYEVVESRPVSAEAAAERVTSDSVVSLGSATAHPLGHKVRLVTIAAKPHNKCTKAPGPDCDGTIRIATNLLDVPAEVIALLYHYRWTIEKTQAICPSSRRVGGGEFFGYYRGGRVARTGLVVPATHGCSNRRNRMPITSRRPAPPRA